MKTSYATLAASLIAQLADPSNLEFSVDKTTPHSECDEWRAFFKVTEQGYNPWAEVDESRPVFCARLDRWEGCSDSLWKNFVAEFITAVYKRLIAINPEAATFSDFFVHTEHYYPGFQNTYDNGRSVFAQWDHDAIDHAVRASEVAA